MTHITTLTTLALLLSVTAATADIPQAMNALPPATTDGIQTVLAGITVGYPADLVYRP